MRGNGHPAGASGAGDGNAFKIRGLDLAETGILEQVRRELCPDDASPPVAEVHALKRVPQRRHFVRHKDSGGILGVPCVHLYNETHGVAHRRKPLSSRSAARLKGRDRLVAVAALRAGLGVRFSPYLYEDCAEQSWRLSRAPTSAEAAIFSGSMTVDELCRRTGVTIAALVEFCVLGSE